MKNLSWLKLVCGAYAFCALAVAAASAQTFTLLHSFDMADGAYPLTLVQATDGSLYGTAFGISPGGTFTTLYNFGQPGGAYPVGPLIQATDGNLYGTTSKGGANDNGIVFDSRRAACLPLCTPLILRMAPTPSRLS